MGPLIDGPWSGDWRFGVPVNVNAIVIVSAAVPVNAIVAGAL